MLAKYSIKAARKVFSSYEKRPFVPFDGYVEYVGQASNDQIREELLRNKPTMICKFGTTELSTIYNYLSTKEPKKIEHVWKYIRREKKFLWWFDVNNSIADLSGFFPATDKMLEKFCELYLQDIKEIDLLGSYIKEECLLKNELAHTKKIDIDGILSPFRYENPWSEVLGGKRVLVVHPFEESIRNQYKKRSLLFKNEKVLPEFELLTIKAVQGLVKSTTGFNSWFEALDYMKDKINQTEFDIAVIGCGAYGMPLAAHVKRLGKKAVHMAGSTQMLFGISGKRWEDQEEFRAFINEHWSKPLPSEAPRYFTRVEGGCYW